MRAETKTWDSGQTTAPQVVNAKWIGFTVPAGVTEGTYNMILDLYQKQDGSGEKSTYIGVFNSKDNVDAEHLVGFSENKPAKITSDQYVTYSFKNLTLTGGNTYYFVFLDSKDSYTISSNRIGLSNSSTNIWTAQTGWVNGTVSADYAPVFKAAISDAGQPVVYQTHTNGAASNLYPGSFYKNYGNSSVAEHNNAWGNLWVSNPAPTQISLKCDQSYISGYNGFFQATTTEATYTIKAAGQYKIKGLRLKGLAERDGGDDCTVTITKPDATTATYSQSDGTTTMIDATLETAATSTTFKVQCDQTDGRVKNVELVVLLETDDNKIAAVSDLGVYNIKLVAGDYYISSASKVATASSNAAKVQFISTGTANQYYLYDVDQKKFYKDVSPDTRTEAVALTLDASLSNATTFNLREDKIPYQYIIEPTNSTNSSCLIAWAKGNGRVIANYTWYSDQYLWELKSVSYDSKALIQAYMDATFTSNFDKAGLLGYPTTTSASYALLKNLTDSIKNTGLANTWRYNADMYNRLQSYYAAYLAETDLVLPATGKFYRLKGAESGKYLKGNKVYFSSIGSDVLENTEGLDGADEKISIFYLDATSQLRNFSSGGYIYETCRLDNSGTKTPSTFSFETPYTTSHFGAFSVVANKLTNIGKCLYSHTGAETYANRQDGAASETDWYLEEVTVKGIHSTDFEKAFVPTSTSESMYECWTFDVEDGTALSTLLDGVNNLAAATATYTRDLASSDVKWGTICLPFELTSDEDIQFYTLSFVSDGALILEEAATVTKGHPAVFKNKAGASSISVSKTAAEIATAPVNGEGSLALIGTFEGLTLTSAANGETLAKSYYVGASSNQFHSAAGVTKLTINPYRAYFEYTSGTPSKSLNILVEGEDDVTAINALIGQGDVKVTAIYNASGVKCSDLQKGLNIVKLSNGKTQKIMLK